MSIFQNIHKLAARVIPRQTIQYRKFNARAISNAGLVATTFGDWTITLAHVQPGIVSSFGGKNISEKEYKELGLDWSKRFYTIWVDGVILSTTASQNSADQVKIGESVFNVIHVADWIEFDGFRRCYVEEVLP